MASKLEEIPIDPKEATDLDLHVRNCISRHVAIIQAIRSERLRQYIYQVIILPLLVAIAAKLFLA